MTRIMTDAEIDQEYIERYCKNIAPENSVRKTIKSGQELLDYAREHSKKPELRYIEYIPPIQGVILKQDIEDVIYYFIEDVKRNVPRQTLRDYEWLISKLDEEDRFRSNDENDKYHFQALFSHYHIQPLIPFETRQKLFTPQVTYYNATRLGEDHEQVNKNYYGLK